jgi:hypothetical protein
MATTASLARFRHFFGLAAVGFARGANMLRNVSQRAQVTRTGVTYGFIGTDLREELWPLEDCVAILSRFPSTLVFPAVHMARLAGVLRHVTQSTPPDEHGRRICLLPHGRTLVRRTGTLARLRTHGGVISLH